MTAHAEGLLDTSAVIALPGLGDASVLPARRLISTITLAELSVGLYTANPDDFRRIEGLVVIPVKS